MGVIFNLGGGHYTAISKLMKGYQIWRVDPPNISVENLVYIDSFPTGGQVTREYGDIPAILHHLESLDVYGAIFVFARDDSYPSVAVQRLNQLKDSGMILAGGARRRRVRNKTKKARKQKRKTRRHA